MEILEIIKYRFQLLVAGEWIQLVQDLRNVIAAKNFEIENLQEEIDILKRPKPLAQDVNHMLRESLYRRLDEDRIFNENKKLSAQVEMLRNNLRQEIAVNFFLQDNLKDDISDFNALSKEKREEYFKKVDALI